MDLEDSLLLVFSIFSDPEIASDWFRFWCILWSISLFQPPLALATDDVDVALFTDADLISDRADQRLRSTFGEGLECEKVEAAIRESIAVVCG